MTELLYGAPVAGELLEKTKSLLAKNAISGYVAIFALRENKQDHPSMIYVRKKVAYAEKLGLTSRIYQDYKDITSVLDEIKKCNDDSSCLGIIVQLPLPYHFQEYQSIILDSVLPTKDIDGLGINTLVLPATPLAVLSIIEYYGYNTFNGKQFAVLGESKLIGRPLAEKLRVLGGNVYTFNEFSDQENMRAICRKSDYIMACTGSLHLVDDTFVHSGQIIVDAGRGMIDGKPTGDVYTEKVMGKIHALTPVPGGVGPVTVASLFWNLAQLVNIK